LHAQTKQKLHSNSLSFIVWSNLYKKKPCSQFIHILSAGTNKKKRWVSSRDLSFLGQNPPYFCFWSSLLPVLLLWWQPINQNSDQAACIQNKVTVTFSHQALILVVTCVEQATANLISDACFIYIIHQHTHGMYVSDKKKKILFVFFSYFLIIFFFQIMRLICH
jgi:hypothetical protein